MHKGPFRYLHGERFTRQDLAMTYLTAVIVTILAATACFPESLGMIQKILLAGLFLDTSGGIVANATASTRDFYASPYGRRVLFIALHSLHPLILLSIFPEYGSYILCAGLSILTASLLVNHLRSKAQAFPAAAGLLSILLTILLLHGPDEPSVVLLLILFAIKLVLCFATGGIPVTGESTKPE
jgi:hypothetical protein